MDGVDEVDGVDGTNAGSVCSFSKPATHFCERERIQSETQTMTAEP